jgi:hypothetical protein
VAKGHSSGILWNRATFSKLHSNSDRIKIELLELTSELSAITPLCITPCCFIHDDRLAMRWKHRIRVQQARHVGF